MASYPSTAVLTIAAGTSATKLGAAAGATASDTPARPRAAASLSTQKTNTTAAGTNARAKGVICGVIWPAQSGAASICAEGLAAVRKLSTMDGVRTTNSAL